MSDQIIISNSGPQGATGPAGSGPGGSLSDGDKGDIVVSGSGSTWTVDAGVIGTTKLGDDITAAGKALLDDADAAAQRTTLGIGTAALEAAGYFATATHSHTAGDIGTFPTDSLVGRSDAGAGVCRDIAIGSGLTIDTGVEPPELKLIPSASQYVETTRTVTAGTGLTGGGTLAADRTFSVAYGTAAGTACEGNDARLTDARTPTAHTHPPSDIQQGGAVTGEVLKWNGSAWAPGADSTSSGGGAPTTAQYFTLSADATLSDERVLTFGTGLTATDGGAGAQYDVEVDYGTTAATACEGNDSRLSDARTPTAHTHDFVDSYVGHIEAPAVGTYYVDTYAATARTVTGIHIVTGSGTVDWTLRRVVSGIGADIYTADGQGTTQANVTSGLSNTAISAGNQLELQIDATSSGADVRFTIVYSRATGAIT